MKAFTTLGTVSTIRNPKTNEVSEIIKIRKDGTRRIFFKPTVDGATIGRTYWTTLTEAEKVAKAYLNR